ncbi:hypothetical protein DSO57_1019760 [Entomophthora muscae]|uniref:Uncharacterized protein n=1 Tax=Entomophthora muscae TaxID=34485 RepID=A0ACC2SSU5_9FUNG|nr:hypothetical protein DSO57_1019760 [Entomophthora muscae]
MPPLMPGFLKGRSTTLGEVLLRELGSWEGENRSALSQEGNTKTGGDLREEAFQGQGMQQVSFQQEKALYMQRKFSCSFHQKRIGNCRKGQEGWVTPKKQGIELQEQHVWKDSYD